MYFPDLDPDGVGEIDLAEDIVGVRSPLMWAADLLTRNLRTFSKFRKVLKFATRAKFQLADCNV